MAWKCRGGRAYCYRSTRREGKVVADYRGSSMPSDLAARRRELALEWRMVTAAAWQAERTVLDAINRGIDEVCDLIEVLKCLALEAAGYHRHDRGLWRRSKMNQEQQTVLLDSEPLSLDLPKAGEVLDVLKRASAGDSEAVPKFQEFFQLIPESMMEACAGDLAAEVERTTLDRIAGNNLATRHALAEKLAALRCELSQQTHGPIERMLVERVVLCWLDCHDWEVRHNREQRSAEGMTFQKADYYQRMRDRSHRRYLQALKCLAQVQKLGPSIQINVARNQVNLAAGGISNDVPACLE